MQAQQRLEFESEDNKRLYEYVERNGVAERGRLESEFATEPERLDQGLTTLIEAG